MLTVLAEMKATKLSKDCCPSRVYRRPCQTWSPLSSLYHTGITSLPTRQSRIRICCFAYWLCSEVSNVAAVGRLLAPWNVRVLQATHCCVYFEGWQSAQAVVHLLCVGHLLKCDLQEDAIFPPEEMWQAGKQLAHRQRPWVAF